MSQDLDELKIEISKMHQRMTDHYAAEEKFKQEIREKLDPMFDIFTQTKGFGNITLMILKSLIVFGAAVAAIYGFIRWLKS